MTPIALILETVASLGEAVKGGPLDVLKALTPLLLEFAMSDAILTGEAVFTVQSRVHRALRQADLIATVDIP